MRSERLTLRVLSKSGKLLETTADSVVLNAADGSLGIHVGHLPALILLANGDIIYKVNGEAKHFSCDGVVAEVADGTVTVMAK